MQVSTALRGIILRGGIGCSNGVKCLRSVILFFLRRNRKRLGENGFRCVVFLEIFLVGHYFLMFAVSCVSLKFLTISFYLMDKLNLTGRFHVVRGKQ